MHCEEIKKKRRHTACRSISGFIRSDANLRKDSIFCWNQYLYIALPPVSGSNSLYVFADIHKETTVADKKKR